MRYFSSATRSVARNTRAITITFFILFLLVPLPALLGSRASVLVRPIFHGSDPTGFCWDQDNDVGSTHLSNTSHRPLQSHRFLQLTDVRGCLDDFAAQQVNVSDIFKEATVYRLDVLYRVAVDVHGFVISKRVQFSHAN